MNVRLRTWARFQSTWQLRRLRFRDWNMATGFPQIQSAYSRLDIRLKRRRLLAFISSLTWLLVPSVTDKVAFFSLSPDTSTLPTVALASFFIASIVPTLSSILWREAVGARRPDSVFSLHCSGQTIQIRAKRFLDYGRLHCRWTLKTEESRHN